MASFTFSFPPNIWQLRALFPKTFFIQFTTLSFCRQVMNISHKKNLEYVMAKLFLTGCLSSNTVVPWQL
jgi:uncharacterized protein involved in response to NO